MDIPADLLKLKVHDEVVVYRIQAAGATDGALGCFHLASGRLAELRLTAPADPDDLQPARVTQQPLAVVLRDRTGHEVTVDAAPPADRRLAVTCTLVTVLARAKLKTERAGAAAALSAGAPLGGLRGSRRPPCKRPPGRSIVNPAARKRTTAAGLSFDSDSQE